MMRHMKRDIMQELLAWKEQPNRKPLVLKGVRQCGKTYILKEFGREYYKDVTYFNFEETRSLSSLFEQDYDVKRILFELGLFLGRTIAPGNTLIILDEIQECPRAITALKYFCENASMRTSPSRWARWISARCTPCPSMSSFRQRGTRLWRTI